MLRREFIALALADEGGGFAAGILEIVIVHGSGRRRFNEWFPRYFPPGPV